MHDVIIFGAGIAGLTAAHELLERGYKVTIYEKSKTVGGFAKSCRESGAEDGMPTEHSWRGYGPFYGNFFDIAKRIPLCDLSRSTIYSNLSKPIKFELPNDYIDPLSKVSFWDKLFMTYHITRCILSNKRREEYSTVSFKKLITDNLSKAAVDKYVKMLGPGLGLDPDKTSLVHVAKYAEMVLNTKPHSHFEYHTPSYKNYKHVSHGGWHVMIKPTNEAWFNPWIIYLKRIGLNIYFGHELIKYIPSAHQISSTNIIGHAVVADNSSEAHTFNVGTVDTIYINSTDPFTFKDVILKSFPMEEWADSINLINEGVHNQIGFTLEFNKKIYIPETTVFSLPDSEFNITFYPQDNFFKKDKYISKTGNSFWSGAVCVTNHRGKLFNKTAIELNHKQLLQEIIYQIFRSNEFIAFIKKNNDKIKLNELAIDRGSIWNEWKYNDGRLKSTRPKWVNTLETHKHRPKQKTNFDNLYIAGAHTKTSTDIWSMEGAVESGKIVASHLLSNITQDAKDKIKIHAHTSPWYTVPFQIADDILYTLYLPNIINMILLICFVLIVRYIKLKNII